METKEHRAVSFRTAFAQSVLPVDCKARTKHDKGERHLSSWPDDIYLQYGIVFRISRVGVFVYLIM